MLSSIFNHKSGQIVQFQFEKISKLVSETVFIA